MNNKLQYAVVPIKADNTYNAQHTDIGNVVKFLILFKDA